MQANKWNKLFNKLKKLAIVKSNKPEACNPTISFEYQQINSGKKRIAQVKLNDALTDLNVLANLYLTQQTSRLTSNLKCTNDFQN